MLHLSPFWFCTNTVPGGLCTALDAAADFGFKYVELSAIDGVSEQIVAEKVCDEYVADVKNELEKAFSDVEFISAQQENCVSAVV